MKRVIIMSCSSTACRLRKERVGGLVRKED